MPTAAANVDPMAPLAPATSIRMDGNGDVNGFSWVKDACLYLKFFIEFQYPVMETACALLSVRVCVIYYKTANRDG